MSASAYYETVQKLYIAYYGRPADPGGLEAWSEALHLAGGDISLIIDDFANSAEAQARFGGLSSEETIIRLYNQLFGRDPESDEIIAAWVSELENNPDVTPQSIALDLLNGALGADLQVVNNRLEAANDFTQYLSDQNDDYFADNPFAVYAGDFAAQHAANWLSTILDDTASLESALTDLQDLMPEIARPAHITVDDIEVLEEVGTVTVIVERSGGLYTNTSFAYSTADGTAESDDDYSSTGGFGLFGYGDQEITVTIDIISDDNPEGREKFYFNYTHNGLTLRSEITILDDGNTAPTANDDVIFWGDTDPVSIDVLDNDTDIDGDTPLSIISINGFDPAPSEDPIETEAGTVWYDQETNELIYEVDAPDAGAFDFFTYTISDGNGGEDTATVYINGNPLLIDFEDIPMFPFGDLEINFLASEFIYNGLTWDNSGPLADEFIIFNFDADDLDATEEELVLDFGDMALNGTQTGAIFTAFDDLLTVDGAAGSFILEELQLDAVFSPTTVFILGYVDDVVEYFHVVATSGPEHVELDWGAIDSFEVFTSEDIAIDNIGIIGLSADFEAGLFIPD